MYAFVARARQVASRKSQQTCVFRGERSDVCGDDVVVFSVGIL